MINNIPLAKEKLQALSEVNSEAISKLTDEQMATFVDALHAKITTFPTQKQALLDALEEKDYSEVFQWLNTVVAGLSDVYADNLVRECEKQIEANKDFTKVRHEKVRAFLEFIISSLEIFLEEVKEVIDDFELIEEKEQTEKLVKPIRTITPKIVREKLLSVHELNASVINNMSDEELSNYLTDLDLYYSDCQAQRAGLSGAVKIKHYVFVLQWLSTIEETLTKIHATDLAAGCREQIAANKDFNNIHHARLNVYINYLLSSMSMLSADIIALGLPKKLEIVKEKQTQKATITTDFEVLATGASESSKKILIVNKMMMFMNSLKNALSDSGFSVIGVSSPEAMVGYMQAEKPDLFVIDEDLQGADTLLIVKAIRASGQKAPIIFTTSKITKSKMVKFMEAGVADFIMKPVLAADVQKKVAKHLQ